MQKRSGLGAKRGSSGIEGIFEEGLRFVGIGRGKPMEFCCDD